MGAAARHEEACLGQGRRGLGLALLRLHRRLQEDKPNQVIHM